MTLSADNQVVQGFWSGPLTTMERLSMASFLANGHRYALYCYDEPAGVPAGVEVRDAREILPESEPATFRCAQQFSDAFRVALLLKKGGWYSDLDSICIKPLTFPAPCVLYRDHDESTISLALSKAPAGAPFLQHCYSYVQSLSKDERQRLSWQEIGTDLILGAVEYFHLTDFAQPGCTFDPVGPERVRELVDPAAQFDLSQSYAIHLFHAAWNHGPSDSTGKGFDLGLRPGDSLLTDAEYPPDSLYEKLKRRYL